MLMIAVMKMLLVRMPMAITLVLAKVDSQEMDSIAQVILSILHKSLARQYSACVMIGIFIVFEIIGP